MTNNKLHLAKISHDFKTPINIILSSVSLLRLKTSSHQESDIQQYLHYIEQNCHRMLRLVNTLTDPSRPDPECPVLLTSHNDLAAFLDHTLHDFLPYSNQQGIEVRFQNHTPGPCELNFDRDLMERILMNLISNSMKHTPSGGTILLSLHADEDYAYVSVTDSGEGFSSETTSRTGLGLTIVKELVELHRGTILISSSAEKGSRVLFSISRHLPHTMSTPSVSIAE